MSIYYVRFIILTFILDSKVVLREIQTQNHSVFKRLFESLYPELVKYANKYLFNTGSSEDVVQEVFIFLWEKSSKINLEINLTTYLYAMVRNRCLNKLKAVKITDISKIIESQAAFDCDYSPGRFTENQILYQKILNAIEHFPAKMRVIVKLRFVDNYRYAEIADELGISVNTVKTQLKRAKVKFGELVIAIALLLSMLR